MRHKYPFTLSDLREGTADPLQAIWPSLTVSLLQSNRTDCDAHWCGPEPFSSPFGRLYWVHAGEGYVEQYGQVFNLKPGWLSIIPAHTTCRYCCPQWMDLSWLHFTAHLFVGIEAFAFLHGPYTIPVDDPAWMEALWSRLLHRSHAQSPGALFEAECMLRQLLSRFLNHADLIRSLSRIQGMAQFSSVFQMVEARLSTKITLADLADLVSMHPTYFSNQFTRVVGDSPMTYVNRRRVERAQRLLRHTEAPLRDIAHAVGFCDEFYFSRVFKHFMQQSPGAFRQQQAQSEP